jgi:hypothetical protein
MFRRVLGHIWRRPVPFVALLFALGGGATAAPALADTTIGQTGGPFLNDCLVGPVTLADTNYVVPAGGRWITSFSYETKLVLAPPTENLDFLVLRPAQGNYTVVGRTDAEVVNSGGVTIFFSFPNTGKFIPVQGGDIVGFYVPSSLPVCTRTVGSGGGLISATGPPSPPNAGDTGLQLPGGDPTLDLNLSADVVTVPTRDECKGVGWFLFGFKSKGQCLIFSRTH